LDEIEKVIFYSGVSILIFTRDFIILSCQYY
jgi:hypothetical protein